MFLPVKSKTEAFAANIAVFVNDLAADGKFHVENVKLFFALIKNSPFFYSIYKYLCYNIACYNRDNRIHKMA